MTQNNPIRYHKIALICITKFEMKSTYIWIEISLERGLKPINPTQQSETDHLVHNNNKMKDNILVFY